MEPRTDLEHPRVVARVVAGGVENRSLDVVVAAERVRQRAPKVADRRFQRAELAVTQPSQIEARGDFTIELLVLGPIRSLEGRCALQHLVERRDGLAMFSLFAERARLLARLRESLGYLAFDFLKAARGHLVEVRRQH